MATRTKNNKLKVKRQVTRPKVVRQPTPKPVDPIYATYVNIKRSLSLPLVLYVAFILFLYYDYTKKGDESVFSLIIKYLTKIPFVAEIIAYLSVVPSKIFGIITYGGLLVVLRRTPKTYYIFASTVIMTLLIDSQPLAFYLLSMLSLVIYIKAGNNASVYVWLLPIVCYFLFIHSVTDSDAEASANSTNITFGASISNYTLPPMDLSTTTSSPVLLSRGKGRIIN